MGNVVGDKETQKNFEKYSPLLGFKEKNREGAQSTLNKMDNRITGKWLKQVKFDNWIYRVIDEKDDKFLLLVTAPGFNKEKYTYISSTATACRWVNKSDVEEID